MGTNYGTVEALAPSYDEADALTQSAYAELGSAAAGVVEQIGTAVDQTQSQATEEMLTTVPDDMGMTGGEMAELMDGYNDVITAVSGEMALLAQSTANQIQMMQANYENLLGGMREGLPYLEQHIDQQMAAVATAGYSSSADAEDDLPEEELDIVNPFEFPETSDEYGALTSTFAMPGFIEQFGPPDPNSIYKANMLFGAVAGLPVTVTNADGLSEQRIANFQILQNLFGWPSERGVDNFVDRDLRNTKSGQAYYRYFQFAIAEGYDPDTALNIADTLLGGTGLPALPDRSDQSIKTVLKWTTIQNSPAARNLMNDVPNITTSSASWDPQFIAGLNVLGSVTGTPSDTGNVHQDAIPEPGGTISPGHQGLANQMPDDPTGVSSADAGMLPSTNTTLPSGIQDSAQQWQQQQNDPIFGYQSNDINNMWAQKEAEARNQARLRDQQIKKANTSRAHLLNPSEEAYYDSLGAWALSMGL